MIYNQCLRQLTEYSFSWRDGKHRVGVVRCADLGKMTVYVDDSPTPLMTATDITFDSGRVGFGSFDNTGRLRDLTVTGTGRASA